jgi:hypothetical protein
MGPASILRAGSSELMLRVAVLGAPFIFFLVLGYRHGIDAAQPAMQVDIGAALRAERLKNLVHRLAADGAELTVVLFGLRHDRNMGLVGRCCQRPSNLRCSMIFSENRCPLFGIMLWGQTAFSQPKWIG